MIAFIPIQFVQWFTASYDTVENIGVINRNIREFSFVDEFRRSCKKVIQDGIANYLNSKFAGNFVSPVIISQMMKEHNLRIPFMQEEEPHNVGDILTMFGKGITSLFKKEKRYEWLPYEIDYELCQTIYDQTKADEGLLIYVVDYKYLIVPGRQDAGGRMIPPSYDGVCNLRAIRFKLPSGSILNYSQKLITESKAYFAVPGIWQKGIPVQINEILSLVEKAGYSTIQLILREIKL